MKKAAVILTATLIGAVPWSAPQPDDHQAVTQFSLLIGKPSAKVPSASGTLLASGTVIPMDGDMPAPRSQDRIEIPLQLADKLKDALRLKSVEVRFASLAQNSVGIRHELLRPRAESSIRIFATLTGFDSRRGTYRIEFRQGETLLADSSLSVEMGKQAVVGALGGDEAPYLFLAVAPRRPGRLVQRPATGKPPLIDLVLPIYPQQALQSKATGNVVLQMTIQKEGNVGGIQVLQSPAPVFSQAAQQAVARWRYLPPRDDQGRPVTVRTTATLVFRLE